jgi:hypothetical protein
VTQDDPVWQSDFERQELVGAPQWDQDGETFSFQHRLDKHRDWIVKAIFTVIGTGPTLVSVSVAPAALSAPESGLTTDVLRAVRVGDLHARARDWLSLGPPDGPWFGTDPAEFNEVRHPGRRGRDDSFYAQVAAWYVHLLTRADHAPAAALAEQMKVSVSSIRGLLYEARRRGLLTNAPPGRAGGQLTDKARGLLHGTR